MTPSIDRNEQILEGLFGSTTLIMPDTSRPSDGIRVLDRPAVSPSRVVMDISSLPHHELPPDSHTLKELFERVEQAKREWESTVDSLPDLVVLIDSRGRILRLNRTIEAWGLAQVERVRGRDLHDLLHPACTDSACYLESFARQVVEHVAHGDSIEHTTYDRVLGRHLHLSARPVFTHPHSAPPTAVAIVRDVTDLKRAEQEREELISELHAFAHTVAHDLKNPISVLLGYMETLDEYHASMPGDEIASILQTTIRVGRKLNSIVDELLLLAEARRHEVNLQPINMSIIVAETLERLGDLQRRHPAEFKLPDDWPPALGCASWVEEVWANYLSNALKYAGRPARIELGSEMLSDGYVRFWVHDNGDGISPDEQAQIFTPFTRLAQARATGYGLGLSIVRRIVEKMGGQVGVESDGLPGHGSRFFFTLMAGS